ncbi:hypothetical protein [Acinetobacter sp. ANC 4216]|uniref:hypothetical protein n=1 Tax=Acinetobacter sp. ANC 4216 TaxID=2529840 RepID=UPI0013F14C59|nr:hypothetical protein [Acinetobacter sp. ANC 4216]
MEINYPQGSKRQISFQIGWKMMRGKDAFINAIHDSAEKCPGNLMIITGIENEHVTGLM